MKAFLIDVNMCNGCRNCQIACKDEHVDNDWRPYAAPEPEIGSFWMRVDEKTRGQVPWVRVAYTPVLCSHCDDAPCVAACPNDAFERRDDGLLILSPEKCNGCGSCIPACPTHSIYFNDELNIAQKCTGCAHLLDNGWAEPRCVDVCPTSAIKFVDLPDSSDAPKGFECLPGLKGDGVHAFYENLPKRFIAGTVVDPEAREVIIGATVSISSSRDEAISELRTDEFGDFKFDQIEPDTYYLSIMAPGFKSESITVDALEEDRSVGDIFMKPQA